MPKLSFWFDYSCPYAYLGSTQVERLAELMHVDLVWEPMLLGGVFRANGTPQTQGEKDSEAKRAHGEKDIARWAALFGVPLRRPEGHPLRTVEALRATIATGCDPRVIHGLYRAYWVEGRPPSDPKVLGEVLTAAGHDAAAVLAKIATAEVKDDLRRRTERAIEKGIFGAPTFERDDGEIFWGQDRMHFVAGRRFDDVYPSPAPRTLPTGAPRRTLEVYWDFSSPFAYLGTTQAEALAARTGAKLVWRPMLLGGLFRTIGQVDAPIATWSPAKQRYTLTDAERWAKYWGVPFRFPSRFPTNSLKAMRCWIALPAERRDAFRERTFRAYWAEDRDITDEAVLRELIGDRADEVFARTQSPEVKKELIDATEHAAKIGVFGAPTWIIDGKELFWGQDRVPLVERALLG